ncbi:MAG: hypothetical protein WAV23_00230 [Minisyncoccia bacterium]
MKNIIFFIAFFLLFFISCSPKKENNQEYGFRRPYIIIRYDSNGIITDIWKLEDTRNIQKTQLNNRINFVDYKNNTISLSGKSIKIIEIKNKKEKNYLFKLYVECHEN